MKTLHLAALALAVACSGDEATPETPVGEVADAPEVIGPPDPPVFADAPGTWQVAWTVALADANRPGPPLVAGSTVEVVAVNDGVATVRTDEALPRTGKVSLERLIRGTRMQPGVTVRPSEFKDGIGPGVTTTPVDAFTVVLPYAAKSGHRAVVTGDGTPRWIAADVLAHTEGDLALGAEVAAIRASLDAGDRRTAMQRLRGIPAVAGESGLVPAIVEAFAGDDEDFEVLRIDQGRVHDPSTGLTWRRCAYGQGWAEDSGTCNGGGARVTLDKAVAACGGYRSEDGAWRLPELGELADLILCDAGVADDPQGGCAAEQATGALLQAFQVPAAMVWTRTEVPGGVAILDLATGTQGTASRDDEHLAICVTEAFDGNAYLQTVRPLPTTEWAVVEEGDAVVEVPADTLMLVALPSDVRTEDAPDEFRLQVRTRGGVRWADNTGLTEPVFPLQAVTEEVVTVQADALRPEDCVEIYGPADRVTAGELVRVIGPGRELGSIEVEVERGCKGASGRTFRAIAKVPLRGPTLRVRSDAADPCADVDARLPPELRDILGNGVPDHPALCSEWRFEKMEPFFPGAKEQWRVYLAQDVHVDATAFTGWIVDGQRIPAKVVEVDAVHEGPGYTLVATTAINALRRIEEIAVYRATLYEWRPVDARLKSGGGPSDETFSFDPETGDLTGSLGLHCRYDDEAVAYQCE